MVFDRLKFHLEHSILVGGVMETETLEEASHQITPIQRMPKTTSNYSKKEIVLVSQRVKSSQSLSDRKPTANL